MARLTRGVGLRREEEKKEKKPKKRNSVGYNIEPSVEWKDKKGLVVVDVSAVGRARFKGLNQPYALSYLVDGEEMNTSSMYGLCESTFGRFGFGDNIDYIFCFDSPSGLLKRISNNYKAGRVKMGNEYYDQINTMYKILEESGYKVLMKSGTIRTNLGEFSRAGLEADHCIAEAVKQNYDYYDEIVVLTNDMDMSYLVDNKVILANVLKKRGDITRENYEAKLKIPYNSMLLKKCMVGDKSDNITGIYRFGDKAFEKFCEEELSLAEGEEILGREVEIIMGSDLSEDKKEQALYASQLVLPFDYIEIYDRDRRVFEPLDAISHSSEEIDYQLFSILLEKYGMEKMLRRLEKEGKI